MVNDLNGINLNNPFEGKLDQLIEYFVEFYGEKYRERISDRIKNTTFVFVDKAHENRARLATEHFNNEENSLLQEFNNEALKILDIDGQPLPLPSFLQLSSLQSWANGLGKDDYASVYMFLKTLIGQDVNNISFKQMGNLFEKVYANNKKEISTALEKLYQLYKTKYEDKFATLHEGKKKVLSPSVEFKRNFDRYRTEYDEMQLSALEKHVNERFGLKEVDITPYLPDLRKWIMDGQNSLTKYNIKNIDEFYNIVAKTNKIKSFGKFTKLLFSNEIGKHLQDIENGYFEKISDYLNGYSENISQIYQGEFLYESEILSSISEFVNYSTCAGYIFPTYSFDQPNKTKNICVLSTYFSLIDSCAIHELNHVVESTNYLKNRIFYSKTGFFKSEDNLARRKQNTQHNDINEIFNEYIALKIHALLQRDDFHLGKTPYKTAIYAFAFPIFQEFIEENLDDAIEARMGDDPDAFAQKIGKENFETLSQIASDILSLGQRRNLPNIIKEILQEIQEKAPGKELKDISLNLDWSKNTYLYIEAAKTVENIRKNVEISKNSYNDANKSDDLGGYYD